MLSIKLCGIMVPKPIYDSVYGIFFWIILVVILIRTTKTIRYECVQLVCAFDPNVAQHCYQPIRVQAPNNDFSFRDRYKQAPHALCITPSPFTSACLVSLLCRVCHILTMWMWALKIYSTNSTEREWAIVKISKVHLLAPNKTDRNIRINYAVVDACQCAFALRKFPFTDTNC